MSKPSAPKIPKAPQVTPPPPIGTTPGFAAFSNAQQHAFAATQKLLGRANQLFDVGLPELQDQFAFQGEQRNFLRPIGQGNLLGGEFATLGAPFFSDDVGSQVLGNLNSDTRDNLVQQGLFDSGTQAELENQNALFLATEAEKIRRQELQFLVDQFSGFTPAVTPNLEGGLGAAFGGAANLSSIGSAFLAPTLADRQLIGQLLGGNQSATNQRNIAQAQLDASATGGGFGGQLGGLLGGQFLFGGGSEGGLFGNTVSNAGTNARNALFGLLNSQNLTPSANPTTSPFSGSSRIFG